MGLRWYSERFAPQMLCLDFVCQDFHGAGLSQPRLVARPKAHLTAGTGLGFSVNSVDETPRTFIQVKLQHSRVEI